MTHIAWWALMVTYVTHTIMETGELTRKMFPFDDDVITIPNHHNDVIKSKHLPCYWPFVKEIHRWPVASPHKGQWRGALMFSLICAKRLSKQSRRRWFETPLPSIWRHCIVGLITLKIPSQGRKNMACHTLPVLVITCTRYENDLSGIVYTT